MLSCFEDKTNTDLMPSHRDNKAGTQECPSKCPCPWNAGSLSPQVTTEEGDVNIPD